MASRFGGIIANALGAVSSVLGPAIYYLLLFIYRPRERMIGLAGIAVIAAIIAVLVYFL